MWSLYGAGGDQGRGLMGEVGMGGGQSREKRCDERGDERDWERNSGPWRLNRVRGGGLRPRVEGEEGRGGLRRVVLLIGLGGELQ